MKDLLGKWRRPDRGWPRYLPGGRIRTTTAAMAIAFLALSWVHQTYQPPTTAPTTETAVVPPGFMPDPAYTWVPRTNVETRLRTTTTTTPTTTTTSPTDTTSPTETTSETETTGPVPTTLVDPDGPGPLTPTTATQTPATSPATTQPNRSGTVTTTTGALPGVGPVSPAPLPPG
ncbi:hypothetical protein TUM20984_41480 [Mycobacterium antarcticum]|nr:hypothetical protein [Mycolicibacterium sp. TUM20984]GLP82728.1 hypothetical protein TUM20984_41480 [Mycolicibacterium sp. TUM20984]